jgi:large subunit ribosomal protein L9
MFLKEEKSLRDASPARVHTTSGSSPQRSKEQDYWLSSHTSAIEGLNDHGGKMRVILRENIENLGKKGDIVRVASGFGRNYLIPKKIAIEVTSRNKKMIEIEQKALQKGFEKEKASYQELIDRLNTITLSFTRKTSEKDVVFGSVSSTDIRDALVAQGFEVEKKKILLDEPIKRLGNYTVPIKIFHEERAEVKLEVVKEGESVIQEDPQLSLEPAEEGAVASEPAEEKEKLPTPEEETPVALDEPEITEDDKETVEEPPLEETKEALLETQEDPLEKFETEPGEKPEESGTMPEEVGKIPESAEKNPEGTAEVPEEKKKSPRDTSTASPEPEGKTAEDDRQEAKSKDNK